MSNIMNLPIDLIPLIVRYLSRFDIVMFARTSSAIRRQLTSWHGVFLCAEDYYQPIPSILRYYNAHRQTEIDPLFVLNVVRCADPALWRDTCARPPIYAMIRSDSHLHSQIVLELCENPILAPQIYAVSSIRHAGHAHELSVYLVNGRYDIYMCAISVLVDHRDRLYLDMCKIMQDPHRWTQFLAVLTPALVLRYSTVFVELMELILNRDMREAGIQLMSRLSGVNANIVCDVIAMHAGMTYSAHHMTVLRDYVHVGMTPAYFAYISRSNLVAIQHMCREGILTPEDYRILENTTACCITLPIYGILAEYGTLNHGRLLRSHYIHVGCGSTCTRMITYLQTQCSLSIRSIHAIFSSIWTDYRVASLLMRHHPRYHRQIARELDVSLRYHATQYSYRHIFWCIRHRICTYQAIISLILKIGRDIGRTIAGPIADGTLYGGRIIYTLLLLFVIAYYATR